MTLYEIYWYPNCPGDREKESTMVLCNNSREAWKVAKEMLSGVIVVEVCEYGAGEEYWADYVVVNGVVYSYEYYKYHIKK